MKIEDLNFSYHDLVHVLDANKVRLLVDFKMNQRGYFKSSHAAEKEGITRAAMSLRVGKHQETYDPTEYGGYVYVKLKDKKKK